MRTNLNALILAELYTAGSYVDRLCHAYKGGPVEFPFSIGEDYIDALYEEIQNQVFISKKGDDIRGTENSLDRILDVTGYASEACKAMVNLDFDPVGTAMKVTDVINIMYRYGYCFHLYAYKTHMAPISVPSPPLADILKIDYKESAITVFYLSADKLRNAFTCGKGRTLYQFQEERDRRFRNMLGQSERLEREGAFDEAEAILLKLVHVKETAPALGLLAKIKFRKGEKELARAYCERGIRKDPDYGPLYNDLGVYWSREGNSAEALKWFGLAKQCIRYSQREEAYINAGRIYKQQKKYVLALEQFTIALEMIPFDSKLRKEVEELEQRTSFHTGAARTGERMTDVSHGY